MGECVLNEDATIVLDDELDEDEQPDSAPISNGTTDVLKRNMYGRLEP